jgi:hypothetical protein
LIKMPPLEEILCRGRFRHPGRSGSGPGFTSVRTRALATACPKTARHALCKVDIASQSGFSGAVEQS